MDSMCLDNPMALRYSIIDNHRRGISSAFILLDEMLCRFERWAKGESVCGVLYRENNDLTDTQRQALLSQMAALRNLMAEIRDSLSLKNNTQNVSKAIWAESSSFWVTLVELESKHLKGYGEIPADSARYLDSITHNLIAGLNKIIEIFKTPSPD